jgi:hypothetical protein
MTAVRLIGERKVAPFLVIVRNLIDNDDNAPAREFLERLVKALEAAVDVAYRNSYLAGREAFRGELGTDGTFWERCRQRWGQGGGYKADIRNWTDAQISSSYDDAHKVLQGLIADEWGKVVGLLERVLKEEAIVPVAKA